MRNRLDRALGQHRAERERHVGGGPHLLQRGRNQPGQPLSAVIRVERDRVPATVDEAAIGLDPAIRSPHDAIFKARALLVADDVERPQHAAGKAATFFKDRVEELDVEIIRARQGCDFVEAGQLGGGEADVSHRRDIVGHWSQPSS